MYKLAGYLRFIEKMTIERKVVVLISTGSYQMPELECWLAVKADNKLPFSPIHNTHL